MNIISFISSLPTPIFWLWFSGLLFSLMTVLFFLVSYQKQKNELMTAFLGFLVGMASFHVLGGASMYWENPLLMYLGSLGAVTGSAFVFKFPLTSAVNKRVQQRLFFLVLVTGWLLVLAMLITNVDTITSMAWASIYMIMFSGSISGTYIIWKGFRLNDPDLKIKCIGGGCSIWFCCFLTHVIVLTIGMTGLAKFFMVMTPITLVASVFVGAQLSKNPTMPKPNVEPSF